MMWKVVSLTLLVLTVAQTVLLIVFVVKPFHHDNSPAFQPTGRSLFAPSDTGLFSKP